MGSPGLALANIFVGYFESKLFSRVQKPTIYFRYVDDTLAIFKQEGDVQRWNRGHNVPAQELKKKSEAKKRIFEEKPS